MTEFATRFPQPRVTDPPQGVATGDGQDPSSVQPTTDQLDSKLPNPDFETERTFPLILGIQRPNMRTGQVETIDKITLKAPMALDFFDIGGTVTRTYWTPTGLIMEPDAQRFRMYIRRLSGWDEAAITQMAARDLKMIYNWLTNELSMISGN